VQPEIGVGGGALIVMCVWQLAVPPGPEAVPVKVVSTVSAGVEVEPAAIGVTLPIPWLIEKAVEFAVVHERSEVLPESTAVGSAERVQVGAEGGGGGFASVQEAVAPLFTPVHSQVYLLELSALFELVPALQS